MHARTASLRPRPRQRQSRRRSRRLGRQRRGMQHAPLFLLAFHAAACCACCCACRCRLCRWRRRGGRLQRRLRLYERRATAGSQRGGAALEGCGVKACRCGAPQPGRRGRERHGWGRCCLAGAAAGQACSLLRRRRRHGQRHRSQGGTWWRCRATAAASVGRVHLQPDQGVSAAVERAHVAQAPAAAEVNRHSARLRASRRAWRAHHAAAVGAACSQQAACSGLAPPNRPAARHQAHTVHRQPHPYLHPP